MQDALKETVRKMDIALIDMDLADWCLETIWH